MIARIFLMAAACTLAAKGVDAQQPIEINNVYPMSEERFQLPDRIYFQQDNRGYFEAVQGPFDDGPARCVGGGFGHRDGTGTIEGICIFGDGADTFTMTWKAGHKGEANTWEIVQGTGRYEGMTGSGIATTGPEVMYKAMPLRQTHIVGTVTLAEQ